MKIPVPSARDNSERGKKTGETVYTGMNPFPDTRIRLCHLCGRLFSLAQVEREPWGICPDCRWELERSFAPFELPRIDGHPDLPFLSLSVYTGPIPSLMEAIKLRRHFRLIRYVAETALIPALEAMPGPLIPLPASPRGRRNRGFDQTRVLAKHSTRPVISAIRRRGGGEQKHLSRTERSRNAERSFHLCCTPPAAAIVIDDVCTTGATVRRAVSLLEGAGAYPAAVVVVSARI
jgi:predicted amidophosphoribosyltransferase